MCLHESGDGREVDVDGGAAYAGGALPADPGGAAPQIGRRAGISEQTLYRWREEFSVAGKQAVNGRGCKAFRRRRSSA